MCSLYTNDCVCTHSRTCGRRSRKCNLDQKNNGVVSLSQRIGTTAAVESWDTFPSACGRLAAVGRTLPTLPLYTSKRRIRCLLNFAFHKRACTQEPDEARWEAAVVGEEGEGGRGPNCFMDTQYLSIGIGDWPIQGMHLPIARTRQPVNPAKPAHHHRHHRHQKPKSPQAGGEILACVAPQ